MNKGNYLGYLVLGLGIPMAIVVVRTDDPISRLIFAAIIWMLSVVAGMAAIELRSQGRPLATCDIAENIVLWVKGAYPDRCCIFLESGSFVMRDFRVVSFPVGLYREVDKLFREAGAKGLPIIKLRAAKDKAASWYVASSVRSEVAEKIKASQERYLQQDEFFIDKGGLVYHLKRMEKAPGNEEPQ